uniref:(northern house mosquito) hypothetical protein n=1 Tax=Culex pipiens TaxID=7175 RepID=A0A8D8GJM0_CULPI
MGGVGGRRKWHFVWPGDSFFLCVGSFFLFQESLLTKGGMQMGCIIFWEANEIFQSQIFFFLFSALISYKKNRQKMSIHKNNIGFILKINFPKIIKIWKM